VTLWPLAVHSLIALLVAGGMLGISALLGERLRERATGEPYESGIVPTGSARVRFSAQFYLVAILFVIFDLEIVFLFAWAVVVLDVGWPGYAGMLFFALVLVVGLIYEWRQGALDWGPVPRPKPVVAVKGVPAEKLRLGGGP
jgi:NADH-quinone oxidoreductase subunit A